MRILTLAVLIWGFGTLFPLAAFAVEKITYDFERDGIVKELVQNNLDAAENADEDENSELGIYESDLNGDEIEEIFVFSSSTPSPYCESNNMCRFYLFARENNALKELGTFRAFDIHIGDGLINGVRPLYVFENPLNQYKYTVYIYQGKNGRYEAQQG
jgi:hypothetical protein